MAYQLRPNISSRSKAKIFKIFPTKRFIRGRKFEISVSIANIGEMYPGGELELEIRYSTHQANRLRGALPSLESGKSFGWPPVIFNALADGYGLIHCNMKPDATFIDESNKAFAREDAVSSIYVLTETDVYTFYALVISAISLAIIALERVIGFVSYVLNHFRG